ncbi:MAG: NUDIX domain-containing protein [Cyanothece sp. SIO1E1]|nr:NUDIX domain-containing protein [Cyanothece sp. SIO1E1]
MNQEKVLFSTNWVTVKETAKGFHYLERKGKDSVAVLLLRRNNAISSTYEVLIRQQPLCIDPVSTGAGLNLYPCPITGGIDAGETPEAAAVREVLEESGFAVQVLSLGHYIVGTQTNETCYLFYADVTGLKPDVAEQDGSYFEAISKNEWHALEYLEQCDYVACQIGYFRLKRMFSI